MKILQQVTNAIRNGRKIESTEILISKSKNRNEKWQNENRSRRTHCTETRVTHEIKNRHNTFKNDFISIFYTFYNFMKALWTLAIVTYPTMNRNSVTTWPFFIIMLRENIFDTLPVPLFVRVDVCKAITQSYSLQL